MRRRAALRTIVTVIVLVLGACGDGEAVRSGSVVGSPSPSIAPSTSSSPVESTKPRFSTGTKSPKRSTSDPTTPPSGPSASDTSAPNSDGEPPPAPSATPIPASPWFKHVATTDNTSASLTVLNSVLTKGSPKKLVFVSHNRDGGGKSVLNDRALGVYYTGSDWSIFNQNDENMPNGASFNVRVKDPSSSAFVHTATKSSVDNSATRISHPATDGKPDAILIVTQVYNPKGAAEGVLNTSPIAVGYDDGAWWILNQDDADMPLGASFNVEVLSPGSGRFVHDVVNDNHEGDKTRITDASTKGRPNAGVFVTQNFNPGGSQDGSFNEQHIGVFYDKSDSRWYIFNNSGVSLPYQCAFNVLVL